MSIYDSLYSDGNGSPIRLTRNLSNSPPRIPPIPPTPTCSPAFDYNLMQEVLPLQVSLGSSASGSPTFSHSSASATSVRSVGASGVGVNSDVGVSGGDDSGREETQDTHKDPLDIDWRYGVAEDIDVDRFFLYIPFKNYKKILRPVRRSRRSGMSEIGSSSETSNFTLQAASAPAPGSSGTETFAAIGATSAPPRRYRRFCWWFRLVPVAVGVKKKKVKKKVII
ncbi:hypothetical protein INT45_002944 [Circinella minor]|uniref:Uncharacterized protein n=1 Tax=Circinella minor TaxID=1195481 RepID=A0A8H7VKY1_9FUNG|nr:hypothetical protein INT45_002944 [Circinella minor]